MKTTTEVERSSLRGRESKILVLGLMLVVLAGIFSPTNYTEAQSLPVCTFSGITDNEANNGPAGEKCQLRTCTQSDTISQVVGIQCNLSRNLGGAETLASPGKETPPPKGCYLLSFGTWGECISWFLARIAFVIMTLAAVVLWISGTLLNYVLDYTILQMAANLKDFTGINIAWKIIRDLMNIAFIFLLVYEGIKIIIGQSDTGKAKSIISGIVLASLLINFSLFFTKVLIDASNIVTIGIYNSIIDSSNVPKIDASGVASEAGIGSVSGLSVPFMNALGLANVFSSASFDAIVTQTGSQTNMLVFFLMGTVVFVIVSFIFFAISIMFIVRYVTLLILLMLSPVAYMGMALPQMNGYAKDWWKALNSQLIFPPVYMIMTLIILTLMQSEKFLVNGNWGEVTTGGSASSMGLLFNFAVIIGLTIASLVIAKSTSTKGSNYIKDATANLTKFAGNAVMGGVGNIGRNTVGRVGNSLVNSERFKNLAFKTDKDGNVVARSGLNGLVTRGAIKTADAAAKSAFDVRGTSTFGQIASATNMKDAFGKADDPKKVNFQKDLEGKGKAAADFAKLLKPAAGKEEEAKKRAAQTLINSDGYKKLMEEERKAKEAAQNHTQNIEAATKKVKEIEKKKEDALTPRDRENAEKELAAAKQELENKQKDGAAILKASEDATKARTDAETKSQDVYKNRVEAYAATFDDNKDGSKVGNKSAGSYLSRYWSSVAKITGGVVLGGQFGSATTGGILGAGQISPTTRADARAIAAAIRKAPNEKKKLTKKALEDTFGTQFEDEEDKDAKKDGGEGEKKEEGEAKT